MNMDGKEKRVEPALYVAPATIQQGTVSVTPCFPTLTAHTKHALTPLATKEANACCLDRAYVSMRDLTWTAVSRLLAPMTA